AQLAMCVFSFVGIFVYVMWSVIFSLALNSVKDNHGALSGILCSGIIGGAIVPLIVGAIGDVVGLRGGMIFLYLTLGFIFSIGFWAQPLVDNKTIGIRNLFFKKYIDRDTNPSNN